MKSGDKDCSVGKDGESRVFGKFKGLGISLVLVLTSGGDLEMVDSNFE